MNLVELYEQIPKERHEDVKISAKSLLVIVAVYA